MCREATATLEECVALFHMSSCLGLGEAAARGSCRGGDTRTAPEAVPQCLSSPRYGKRSGAHWPAGSWVPTALVLCNVSLQSFLPRVLQWEASASCLWDVCLVAAERQSLATSRTPLVLYPFFFLLTSLTSLSPACATPIWVFSVSWWWPFITRLKSLRWLSARL